MLCNNRKKFGRKKLRNIRIKKKNLGMIRKNYKKTYRVWRVRKLIY